jgi:hypothetical protein
MKKRRIHIMILLTVFALQGCFQDYTIEQKTLAVGKIVGKTEQQQVGFQNDFSSTFPSLKSRLNGWTTTSPQIIVTDFTSGNLPDLGFGTQTGHQDHFELWAVGDNSARRSFGKFVKQGSDLYSYNNGVVGASVCALTVGNVQDCTFQSAGLPTRVYSWVEVTIEPSSDDNNDTVPGSTLLRGNILKLTAGTVQDMSYPVAFSNGNVATGSMTLYAEEAREGRVTMQFKYFPKLDNGFAYQLWTVDDIGGKTSCGIFNFNSSGEVSDPDGNTAKGSDIFSCGVDLTLNRKMEISLEPRYTGNAPSQFSIIPFTANYEAFNDVSSYKISLHNVRVSVAGEPDDAVLTDIEGNFAVPTSWSGNGFLVFRGQEWDANFKDFNMTQGTDVKDLEVTMIPKAKGVAVFHLFEQDFPDETITSARVIGNFQSTEFEYDTGTPMYDDGKNGDAIAGDGVWTAEIKNLTKDEIEYKFAINGDNQKFDPHAEIRKDDDDTIAKMKIRQ